MGCAWQGGHRIEASGGACVLSSKLKRTAVCTPCASSLLARARTSRFSGTLATFAMTIASAAFLILLASFVGVICGAHHDLRGALASLSSPSGSGDDQKTHQLVVHCLMECSRLKTAGEISTTLHSLVQSLAVLPRTQPTSLHLPEYRRLRTILTSVTADPGPAFYLDRLSENQFMTALAPGSASVDMELALRIVLDGLLTRDLLEGQDLWMTDPDNVLALELVMDAGRFLALAYEYLNAKQAGHEDGAGRKLVMLPGEFRALLPSLLVRAARHASSTCPWLRRASSFVYIVLVMFTRSLETSPSCMTATAEENSLKEDLEGDAGYLAVRVAGPSKTAPEASMEPSVSQGKVNLGKPYFADMETVLSAVRYHATQGLSSAQAAGRKAFHGAKETVPAYLSGVDCRGVPQAAFRAVRDVMPAVSRAKTALRRKVQVAGAHIGTLFSVAKERLFVAVAFVVAVLVGALKVVW
jgi:hypothetical protein